MARKYSGIDGSENKGISNNHPNVSAADIKLEKRLVRVSFNPVGAKMETAAGLFPARA